MSSICGLVHRDGRPVAGGLQRMIAVLSHWGPDATGAWEEGDAALGHLALWTTPEAVRERCPWREPASGIVVTADARIDNRDDLIPALGLGGRPAAAIGDVELIGHAYLAWGTACAERLIGDFAFAIWDARAKRLFCARDPVGMRPFFYFADARRFLFGTEIKAIFAAGDVARELNDLPIAAALAGLPTFDDQTAFKSIRALEPASALCVDERGLRVWKYWRLELGREIRLRRDEDYADAMEEILRRAVNARLRSHARVGCLLSGGLDATTCLALAMRGGAIAPDRLSAFSWALRENDDWWIADERPFIEAFLRENPIDHTYVFGDPSVLFDLPPEMRRHQDVPESRVDHYQMIPTVIAARAKGVRVLLHGAGGDETASYGGPDYVLSRLLAGDVAALLVEIAARGPQTTFWWRTKTLLRPLLDPARLRMPFQYQQLYGRRCERVADLSELGIPLPAALAKEIGLESYVREVSRPRLRGAWLNPLRAHQIYALTQTHVMSDQVAAWGYQTSYGIESRCPYLDRRVIEFAVAVPEQQHRCAGVSRRLLRRVAARYLPAKIAGRDDKSSTAPDLGRA
ncbi:MAG: hypothetical protein RLZZ15_2130, partial [Verrucomicrobiota bacterium]